MGTKKRIAIVVQRWNPDIAGGSESLAWQYATLLKEEYQTELITTTARNSETWDNELAPGETRHEGVLIRRFAVTGGRSRYWYFLHKMMVRRFNAWKSEPQREPLPLRQNPDAALPWSWALQEEWIRRQGPHSESLLEYLERHEAEYRAVIFMTYLYSPSYFGSYLVDRERQIFVPTLHDEPPAYLSVFRHMAGRARRIFWLTGPERELGHRLWGELPGRLVSMGIRTDDSPPEQTSPGSVTGTEDPKDGDEVRPFVLYCGRIDPGKGCDHLFEHFIRFRRENPGSHRLILTGDARMKIPGDLSISFEGFVSESRKFQLMRQARVFIMPSPLESLSVVTLEAMARKTPVLVNGDNPVLARHVRDSGGGVAYHDYVSFARELNDLLTNHDRRRRMGERGSRYVRARYDLQKVRRILIEEIERLK